MLFFMGRKLLKPGAPGMDRTIDLDEKKECPAPVIQEQLSHVVT